MQDPTLIDGPSWNELPAQLLTALGNAVVAVGSDLNGVPALALWQVSSEGAPTGAWVVSQDEIFNDENLARQLLSCVDGRAVTGESRKTTETTLGRLAEAAGLEAAEAWWRSRSFSPVDAFKGIVARRVDYEKSVGVKMQSNKNIVPLEWTRDFSVDDLPADLDALRLVSTLGVPGGAPVVREALTVSRVLRWLVGQWSETEQTKNRRRYLRDDHGEPEALPPSWLVSMQAAKTGRLPL